MSENTSIGFIGLGQMGGAMAERLLGQSFQLHVHDTSAGAMARFVDAGAMAHSCARSVADAATIVFACLPKPAVSLDVAFGRDGIAHGKAVRIYAEMSTIGTDVVAQIAAGLAEKNIDVLDAPVTGGPPAARQGTLAMLAAGKPAAVAAARPLLEIMGKDVYVLGDHPGMAQMMKVINNIIMGANMVVACEGLSIGAKAGLDAGMMLRVLRAGTGQSFSACNILQRGVAGTFDFGAALSIVAKDMALGIGEAQAIGVDTPALAQANQAWQSAVEALGGDGDFTRLLNFFEEKIDIPIRQRGASPI